MTIPVVSQTGTTPRRRSRGEARLCVTAARLLILLPPRRLRQVLRLASYGSRRATAAQALHTRRAVVAVSTRCAGLGCIQRSVAAALMCRLHGRWPDWCAGFRTQPFRAHAWVEVDRTPVGEPEDLARFHTVLAVRHQDRGRT